MTFLHQCTQNRFLTHYLPPGLQRVPFATGSHAMVGLDIHISRQNDRDRI